MVRAILVSIMHLEGRAVLGPRLAMIVNAGSGNIAVAEPLLDLGDIGLVVERIGGGRRAQRVRADLETEIRGIFPHQLVDAVGRERLLELAGAVVADRAEQRAALVLAMPGGLEWFANLTNRNTRRAYEKAVGDFMRFTGINRPEEFRTVTRAHVIAWRDDWRAGDIPGR
jgi:hypothetical protein